MRPLAVGLRLWDGELKRISIAASVFFHAALVAAILLLGVPGGQAPRTEPRSIDLVSIEELLPPPPKSMESAPLAESPAMNAAQAETPPSAPAQAVDPVPTPTQSADSPSSSASGMALPVGNGSPGGVGTGSGAGEPDYLPQFKLTEIPVVPMKEVLSKIQYPPLAAKQGIEATVYLELLIDDAGRIRKVVVLKDPGYGFAQAAIDALTGVVCAPAKVGDRSAAVRFRYPVRFTLK